MHMNLCDPMSTQSLLGSKYFLSILLMILVEGHIYIFLKVKSETLNVFKIDKKEVKNQLGEKIKVFILVQGGEFTSRVVVRFCEE